VIAFSCPSRSAPCISSPWKRYGGPEGSEGLGQLRDPVHALLAEEHLERVGAVAPELLTVEVGHARVSFLTSPASRR
jgi:hypothetical protein